MAKVADELVDSGLVGIETAAADELSGGDVGIAMLAEGAAKEPLVPEIDGE